MTTPPPSAASSPLARRHLAAGYAGLCLFATAGLVLEMLHAYKSGLYLDVGQETRRLLLRLGHAHGTLLCLLNVVFSLSLPRLASQRVTWASRTLLSATVLLPMGFLLGGLGADARDPGLGIVLVPPGAILLIASLALTARAAMRQSES